MFEGIVINNGLSIENVFVKEVKNVRIEFREVQNISRELDRLEEARKIVEEELKGKYERTLQLLGEDEAKIYRTHLKTLNSSILVGQVKKDIQEKKINAEFLLNRIRRKYYNMYGDVGDSFLKKKSDSIQYIIRMLILKLLRFETNNLFDYIEGRILIAKHISKNDYLQLADKKITGIIVEDSSKYAYAKILAETQKIPLIVGVKNISKYVDNSARVILDCSKIGVIILNPRDDEVRMYEKMVQFNNDDLELDSFLQDVMGEDEDYILTSSIENKEVLKKQGPVKLGFIKTEFSYIGREKAPSVEELVKDYEEIIEKNDTIKPITFRVLDVSSEQDVPFAYNIKESNPRLGLHGSKWLLNNREILINQLLAIIIATKNYDVNIAFPNITHYSQLLEIKLALDEAKLLANVGVEKEVRLGLIIDTPASALSIENFSDEIDFVLIDSTKLIELIKGVDRNNEYVSDDYDPISPSVLRFVYNIVEDAHHEGLSVSIMGVLSNDGSRIPLLIGMGVDKIIIDGVIKNSRWYVFKTVKEHWNEVVERCIECKSSYNVRMILNEELTKITSI